MGIHDGTCTGICPKWSVAPKVNDAQERMCSFSQNKGYIVRVWEQPAVSRFGVLPRALSLFYVLLHRSSIAPMRCAHLNGQEATFQWCAEEVVTVWAG